MKYKDYKIIENDSGVVLQNLVNEYLNKGYMPLGGISIIPHPTRYSKVTYLQAIVFMENDDECKTR